MLLGCVLKGDLGSLVFIISLLFLEHDERHFALSHTVIMMCWLSIDPGKLDQLIIEWNPQICKPTLIFSHHHIVPKVFCYNDGILDSNFLWKMWNIYFLVFDFLPIIKYYEIINDRNRIQTLSFCYSKQYLFSKISTSRRLEKWFNSLLPTLHTYDRFISHPLNLATSTLVNIRISFYCLITINTLWNFSQLYIFLIKYVFH